MFLKKTKTNLVRYRRWSLSTLWEKAGLRVSLGPHLAFFQRRKNYYQERASALPKLQYFEGQ
jgi:hypothetical protein